MSPLVIQEAFAAGLPVIASNVHGNAEQIIHGHNGLLFKFNDVDSLKEQLAKCIADKRILVKMKKNIINPRNFDAVAEEYISLYRDILR